MEELLWKLTKYASCTLRDLTNTGVLRFSITIESIISKFSMEFQNDGCVKLHLITDMKMKYIL